MTSYWLEKRWRYQKADGTAVWLAFDPSFLCVYCNHPVGSLSMGGPALCPACGTFPDGSNFSMFYFQAAKRINELPTDPLWEIYENGFRLRSLTEKVRGE